MLTEPLTSIFNGYTALKKYMTTSYKHRIQSEFQKDIDSQGKGISYYVKDKIINFLKEEIGIDTSKIVFSIQSEGESFYSPIAASGSLKYSGLGIILLSSKIIEEIEREFLPSHKFALAREIGHIINDDNGDAFLQNRIKSSIVRLVSYSISTLAINILFPHELKTIISSHIIGCGISKIAGFMFDKNAQVKQEILADKYAMERSIDIAKGGIDLLIKEKLERVDLRESIIQLCDIMAEDSYVKIISKKMGLAIFSLFLSENGDGKLDFDYPPISIRLETLNAYVIKNS
ncbi:MAG: hypothetical protein H0U49_03740 [Parachlamydiaceae bacterium]|nr:hypothetical protein [Parachlamydiaceae bacterium]